MTSAISTRRLSKRYRIGEKQAGYKTLRDTIRRLAAAPLARRRGIAGHKLEPETIWALRDVSFEVRPGEVVGVIGRNGAGKSTLLKILSRITEPTEGDAVIRGRVGSLLEVGTGFHQELTGRENTYLNGAILGMRRQEIDRKLDEIVAFAELEKFLDTPVKHYSSGMYLRLAFAVAAHMETEILLVDEVLAVGDLRFQQRCLGKMESVAAQGRTVLFVSHNLGALKELCQTALVLEDGRAVFRGPIVEGLAHYTQVLASGESASGRGTRWSAVSAGTRGAERGHGVQSAQPFEVEATLDVQAPLRRARLYCLIEDSSARAIVHNFTTEESVAPEGLPAGRYRVRVSVPPLFLISDVYTLHFKLIGRRTTGEEERCLSERVVLNVQDGSGQSSGNVRATLVPPLDWRLEGASPEAEAVEAGAAETRFP